MECSDASADEVNVATGLAFKELGENKEVIESSKLRQNAFYCLGIIKGEFKKRQGKTTSAEEAI